MDTCVWEVNFNHRDDALNALMTLRTVPHLTVTWAHQNSSQEQGRSDQHTPIIPPVEEKNKEPPGATLPRAQSDAALSMHTSKRDDKGTDLAVAKSDAPTRRTSLSEDGFPPLVGKPVSWADDETLPPSDSSRTLKTTSEYGSVPPTPGFTSGSISPTTPLTFSSTPTTPHSAQFPGGFTGGSGSPQYDCTSLFVGGLPPSWEEDNVRNVFGRFSGLEEVQLIRPAMKKGSSFAFVKFDNTESPRKAIEAENDCVHDGRRIRVQIRDLNPPGRFAWRRGIQRHLAGGENHDSFAMSDLEYTLHADPGGGSVNPSYPYPTIHQEKAGPLEPSASVTTTPQPSTPGQQTSFVPYPYHAYYPATHWTYPHYPYPMHYYHGYPTYGHMQPYPPPATAVYNPYAVVQPPTPTDPPATSSQPPGPNTPIKPVYNATEHSSYYSDFQSDGPEARSVTTPPSGHPPAMTQATPPPPTSYPPPVASHPYPPYNPMQWTPAGPTTPHIHTPGGVYTHFPAQAQMTPGRHTPTFPMGNSAPHNHQQRDSHRGRRNQRHQQRNANGTDEWSPAHASMGERGSLSSECIG
ncbi:hypothetical protein BDM02DRAFT_1313104 [Thelephora ganbajun]|uniref:Uncharacterized protein n=1 Tax=Thelephora ganbajun TaxID=370292 RepID=A0ACB6Z3X3_THEGA|nr:hypothetical protein BDM02DRAFT_1313104 [Thelephora ganbajun]